MSTVTVRIPAPLRSYTQGADEVQVAGSCVANALASLSDLHDGLLARILDQDGEPRQFVNIYIWVIRE